MGRLVNDAGTPEASTIAFATKDGVTLRATVREAKGRMHGVAVLAHAMFARRSEWERPRDRGVAEYLASRGWKTFAFDFRGHGDSGIAASDGGQWSYDDLVSFDLPAAVAEARRTSPDAPIVVVGHSLGGHVALAASACGYTEFDALVSVATNLWLRDIEPSRRRWAMKRATIATMDAIARVYGRFPARKLGIGSDDESSRYFRAVARVPRVNEWKSDDGTIDYRAEVARSRLPVRSIASDGDRLNCPPDCAERFLNLGGGPKMFDRIAHADDGSPPPGHMEIVTSNAARTAWERAADWMTDRVASR